MRATLLFLVLMVAAAPLFGQTYVGDTTCEGCHTNSPTVGFFEGYMNSGHPWKIFNTAGATPAVDTWPHTPVPPLPMVNSTQLQWSEVDYVIGNYFWKARFIDLRGYIYTGSATDSTQWNLQKPGWVQYHAGEVDKPFDCGRCHTTGYDPAGNQNGLPGLIGTWTEDGVRCEACHGPGSDHAASPLTVPPPGGKECADCHYRDAQFRMPWKGGFGRHHQQSEDLSHSSHTGLTCESCHNPHRSTVYDDGGVTTTCSGCHPGNVGNNFYSVMGMPSVECIDCHMPDMAKSGQNFNAYIGDVRGHLFQIMTDPVFAVDNTYDDGGNLYWNQDANGDGFVTLDYACMGCHIDIGAPLTMGQASAVAQNIHVEGVVPVKLAFFQVQRTGTGATLEWEVTEATDHAGFHVYRQLPGADRVKLTDGLLAGKTRYSFVDDSAPEGQADYWLSELDRVGGVEWYGPIPLGAATPSVAVTLAPAWPNPFNASTSISYLLPQGRNVQVKIFDANGRWVRTLVDGFEGAGKHVVRWDGRTEVGAEAAQGVYIVRLISKDVQLAQKIVFTR